MGVTLFSPIYEQVGIFGNIFFIQRSDIKRGAIEDVGEIHFKMSFLVGISLRLEAKSRSVSAKILIRYDYVDTLPFILTFYNVIFGGSISLVVIDKIGIRINTPTVIVTHKVEVEFVRTGVKEVYPHDRAAGKFVAVEPCPRSPEYRRISAYAAPRTDSGTVAEYGTFAIRGIYVGNVRYRAGNAEVCLTGVLISRTAGPLPVIREYAIYKHGIFVNVNGYFLHFGNDAAFFISCTINILSVTRRGKGSDHIAVKSNFDNAFALNQIGMNVIFRSVNDRYRG